MSENAIHAFKHGLSKSRFGEKSPIAKYTEKDVIAVCELLSLNKYTNAAIAKKTNTSPHFVANIKNNVCWKHIRKNYLNIKTDIPLTKRKKK